MVNPEQITRIKEVLNTLASDQRYQSVVEFRQNMPIGSERQPLNMQNKSTDIKQQS